MKKRLKYLLTHISDMANLVSANRVDAKEIEYECGCKYSFNRFLQLVHVCPEHEKELIA